MTDKQVFESMIMKDHREIPAEVSVLLRNLRVTFSKILKPSLLKLPFTIQNLIDLLKHTLHFNGLHSIFSNFLFHLYKQNISLHFVFLYFHTCISILKYFFSFGRLLAGMFLTGGQQVFGH